MLLLNVSIGFALRIPSLLYFQQFLHYLVIYRAKHKATTYANIELTLQ